MRSMARDAEWTLRGDEGRTWLRCASETLADGIPRRRYRKNVMKVGTYVKDSEGIEFEITTSTLRNWVDQFSRMRANGVKVPIPSTHEGASDPDKIRGYVEDLFVEDDTLVMTCEMIGEDAIAAASRNDVSIHSPYEYTDGQGIVYARPIQHVALCPDPVVSGLGEFVPIAASRAAKQEKKIMKWTKVKEVLGCKEELTDDNAVDLICSMVTTLKKELTDIQASLASKSDDTDDAKKDEQGEGDSKGSDAPVTASLVAPDGITVKVLTQNRVLQLEALVVAGHITPATCDGLKKQFAEKVAISAELKAGTDIEAFDKLIDSLKKNDPVKLHEQTGPQIMELSRQRSAKDNANVLLDDADVRVKEAATIMGA